MTDANFLLRAKMGTFKKIQVVQETAAPAPIGIYDHVKTMFMFEPCNPDLAQEAEHMLKHLDNMVPLDDAAATQLFDAGNYLRKLITEGKAPIHVEPSNTF